MPNESSPSPAERVRAIAERYANTAFSDISKVIVVTQDEPRPSLQEKSRLAEAALQALSDNAKIAGTSASGRSTEEKALYVMSRLDSPDRNVAYAAPYVGALQINASDFERTDFFKNDSSLEAKFTVLHELAHINMTKLDNVREGFADFKFTNDYDYRLVSGWDRNMPADMRNDLINATGRTTLQHLDRPAFPLEASDQQYSSYVESTRLHNQQAEKEAIKTLHSLVSETYADAFAILSYAVKEGAKNGAKMAEGVSAFRVKESEFEPGTTYVRLISEETHDSSRGMSWLASYLRSPAGERLVKVLNDQSTDQPSLAMNVSKAASTFVEVNVRRWAEYRGMDSEQAKELAQWVHGQHHRAYNELSQGTQSLAVEKPQVFSHDKATIESLGKPKSDLEPMKAQDPKTSPSAGTERVMELSRSQRF